MSTTPNIDLTKVLKKYVNKKLFESEQEKFKREFFKELFDPIEEVDYSLRTTLFINAVLEEENLPFVFIVDYEIKGIHDNEKYWLLKEL